jgi:hypothetical protein
VLLCVSHVTVDGGFLHVLQRGTFLRFFNGPRAMVNFK